MNKAKGGNFLDNEPTLSFLKLKKTEDLKAKLRQIVTEKDGLLTYQEQRAFIYHVYESRSLKECADLMDCTSGTVSIYLNRAINKLKFHFR